MALKLKSVYFCNNCGYESSKLLGQCPKCREWNTFVEEKVQAKPKGSSKRGLVASSKPIRLSDIESLDELQTKLHKAPAESRG